MGAWGWKINRGLLPALASSWDWSRRLCAGCWKAGNEGPTAGDPQPAGPARPASRPALARRWSSASRMTFVTVNKLPALRAVVS